MKIPHFCGRGAKTKETKFPSSATTPSLKYGNDKHFSLKSEFEPKWLRSAKRKWLPFKEKVELSCASATAEGTWQFKWRSWYPI